MDAPFGGGKFIADKSVWARSDRDPIRSDWARALRDGQILTCPITILELLYSARSRREFDELEEELGALESVPVTPRVCEAAVGAMRALAGQSHGAHRIAIPDYVIAACAQEADVGVLHYDHDYDKLCKVLSFRSVWASPPGTLDREGEAKK